MGVNICNLKETILTINNSTAQLPEDFKAARMLLKTDVIGDDVKSQDIKEEYIYKQRIENPAYYDYVNQTYISTCKSKIITEKVIINNKQVNFYHRPEWLSIVKGVENGGFATNCLNLHPAINKKYKNTVSINRNTINTNFSKGTIYLQYYALPTDEDGEVYIPEMTTGDFTIYCESYVKEKLIWELIANNKNPQALMQLYAPLKQEMRMLKSAAMTECAFWGLSDGWDKKVRDKHQKLINSFELPRI
jgi:hypothetical protein